jgi:hypothetical protein
LFITKYDSTGQKIWVFQTNSTNGAIGSSLYFDPEGNFYSTGTVYGTAVFGNDTINPSITSMILARFDTSGNCIGVRFEGLATGMNVAVDGSGNAYVNGGFYNSISFDSNPTMTSYGSGDIYIAKSSAIVGIGERESPGRNELLIYANPTTGKCNVNIPGEFEHEKKLTLSIFDTNGKLIQQKPIQMSEDKIRLNLEAEAKGIYNVTLTNGKKVYNGRIVFE